MTRIACLLAEALLAEALLAEGEPSQPSCLRPGVASSLRSDLFNPHSSDRSPPWIYPNLIDPNTPCREPMPNVAWKKGDVRRSRGNRSSLCLSAGAPKDPLEKLDSPGRPHRSTADLEGRLTRHPAKGDAFDRTQGAFLLPNVPPTRGEPEHATRYSRIGP